jgi:hypothetical protein
MRVEGHKCLGPGTPCHPHLASREKDSAQTSLAVFRGLLDGVRGGLVAYSPGGGKTWGRSAEKAFAHVFFR